MNYKALVWVPPNSQYPPPKAGEPPLHRAARLGDQQAIRQAVAADADLEEVFDLGLDPGARAFPATPLMVAAGSGDGATLATVELLLELGADPKREVNGENVLSFACRGLGWNYRPGGDIERLRRLLEAGAQLPRDRRVAGRLVADLAQQGDPARLRALLELGAPVNPVWEAADGQAAVQGMRPILQQAKSRLSAIFARFSNDIDDQVLADCDEMQKRNEARLAAAPFPHQIPLFQAAESGNVECVRLLLDRGADWRIRDFSGRTALFYTSDEAVMRLLLKCGLSTEETDDLAWTPLVAHTGEPDRVRALIAVGADVNAVHDRGFTVFMSAAGKMERNVECLRLLIEAGADPYAVSELGWNAFHAAVDASGDACAEESVRGILGMLRDVGVDLERRNKQGHTPLARAIFEGSALEVEVLCELGADVNVCAPETFCGTAACRTRDTPLIFAAVGVATEPHKKLAALLKAGVRCDVHDAQGKTPLQAARERLREMEAAGSFPDSEDFVLAARACVELLERLQ